ncbi:unnamed protein product [Orchesella dallaii]|uniref:Cadherin domain-containing protein n=1 Tax=Orchesella dallaii TaxID=48710 RepID=A0ABP1RQJ6_9HEXA
MLILKNKSRQIGWSLWKMGKICWCFSLLLADRAEGGFSDPILEPAEDPIEGVVVNPNGIQVTVKENVGEGLTDGFVIAKIMLTEPGDVQFLGEVNENFSVEPGNADRTFWNLRQRNSLDFEKLGASATFNLPIENPRDTDFWIISVIIEDVNDEIPRYDRTEPDPILPIDEFDFNPDEELFKVIALDNDAEDMRLGLVYTVVEEGSGGSVPLRIDDQGGVFLTVELDYWLKTSYRLKFTFKDQREPFFESSHSLTIQVQDVPNRPPVFTRPPTVHSVNEGLGVGESLFTVEAVDEDYGLNWGIAYELIDENTPNLFEITDTGEVKVLREIDAEDQALLDMELLYSFKILAKEIYDEDEYGDLTPEETESEVEVVISIVDENDNPPTVCSARWTGCVSSLSYSFSIPEDHTGQVLDEPLLVKDIDSTTKYIRFSATFAASTPQKIIDAFSISPSQGIGEEEFQLVVKNVAALDFEDEFWHDENNEPKPVSFEIEIKSLDDEHPEHVATATVTATVTDVNDNTPTFQFQSEGQTQYEFMICENTPAGTTLKNIIPSTETPNACRGSTEGVDIEVFAVDLDITTEAFGQDSVVYRWSSSSRTPPIDVNPKTGKMTMNDQGNFDYERLKEEIFVVEAVDCEGVGNFLANTVPISFKILDVNDVPVDLRFLTTHTEIFENTSLTEPVLEGIFATDVDVTANIKITMNVSNAFALVTDPNENLTKWSEISGLDEDIAGWFALEIIGEQSNDTFKVARIIMGGEKIPDREGYGIRDVDHVNLLITATDENTETNYNWVSQVVTITLKDINDNPPRWFGGEDFSNLEYLENEEWGEEGDQSSDLEREIFRFPVIDPDSSTTFSFSLSNPECRKDLSDSICDQILELVELFVPNNKIGNADLRRVKGKMIDREQREYFYLDSDILEYLVTVSDGENTLESKFNISVGDRNDNIPIFKENYNESRYIVDDLVTTEEVIGRIEATDEDHPVRYGNVSYLIVDDGHEGEDDNGMGKFSISIHGGVLTALPGTFNLTAKNKYQVQIKAIDNYRSSDSSGSNFNVTFLKIYVININKEFLTTQGGINNPLVEIKERDLMPNRPFHETILLRDWENSELENGKNYVKILKVVKEKDGEEIEDPEFMQLFKLGSLVENKEYQWELPIIPTKNFTGLWGAYTITLEASNGVDNDPTQQPCEAKYVIKILSEHLNDTGENSKQR